MADLQKIIRHSYYLAIFLNTILLVDKTRFCRRTPRVWQLREGEASIACTAQNSSRRRLPLNAYEDLNHSVWDCKHHVVWMARFRKKISGSSG